MTATPNILVVEDNVDLAFGLRNNLEIEEIGRASCRERV